MADDIITKEELESLKKWMQLHSSNEDKWPFNEIKSMIDRVLEDGIIDSQEQKELMKFFKDFIEEKICDNCIDSTISDGGWMNSEAPILHTIQGVIDKTCKITIEDNSFCITGQMLHGKRADVQELISDNRGIPAKSVTKKLDYLVIGALSNPVWAYSTYGRKIEKVMEYNNSGSDIKIIHEEDLMKAINT